LSESHIRRIMITAAVAGAVLLGACSSAAVTGMKVHMQNGEYQDVVHLADSIIADVDSLDPEVWFWRGKALTELSQWQEAARSFEKVWELGETETMAVHEYWFTFYNAAAGLLNEGDQGAAVEMLQSGMLVAPKRPDFDMMLGDLALNADDDLQSALEHFTAASEKAEILIEDIKVILDSTDDPWELDYYSQGLGQAEGILIQSLYNTGSIYTMFAIDAEGAEKEENVQNAIDAYVKALDVDPTNVDVLDAMAGAYLILEDYQAALNTYDEALDNIQLGISEGWLEQEDADDLKANILVSKGYALIEMEQYQDAIAQLNEARSIIGDDFIVLSSMAHANFVMEQYQDALDLLDSVLMIEGLSPDELANAYYTQYACYNRLEMDEEAAGALETALEFQPDNANYWRYLASTYSRLGRRNDAIEALERAEELSPSE
jgi:tetratricopeptide (TPR) repeat protein